MTGLKKKIVIALLAATCLTAGAFGLSACGSAGPKGDKGDKGDTPQISIGANGNWFVDGTDTGVSATGGKGDKGDSGRGIDSIKTIGGEFIVFYTDGTYELIEEADDLPFKLVKVTALDQSKNPVKDAYLQLYYYDDIKTYRNHVAGTAVTNSNGTATFIYVPAEGFEYNIRLADYGKTEYDSPTPEGYEILYPADPDGSAGISFTVPQSDGVLQTVTVDFKNVNDSFSNALLHNKIVKVPYSRKYDTETSTVVETNGTEGGQFTLDVKAGYHTYVSFESYVSPAMTENEETNDQLLYNATAAAAGVYKISVSGGNSPVLYYYLGSSGYMPADANGVPNDIISHTGNKTDGDDAAATETNYITINHDQTLARATLYFGLCAASDCKVTLTIERTGDAEEIPNPEIVQIAAPTGLTKWPAKAAGETLTLMPITGAYTAVKGDDGYYHVNSKTGPIITVMLTRAVSRYLPDFSLKDYPTSDKNDFGESVLHFNPTDSNEYFHNDTRYPLKKYDYNKVLAEYSKWVNTDGVYGVDETVYKMLTGLARTATGIDYANAADGCQWLLPCYYYEPAGGLTAPGSGTSADPYVMNVGTNKVTMTGLGGSAQLKFSVTAGGVYAFKTGGTLSISGYTSTQVDDTLYVRIPQAGDVTLTLTGSSVNYNVTISESKTIETFLGSGSGDDATPSKGVDADTAISVIGTGVWNIVDNKDINDGVYIKFACDFMGAGNYTLTVYGDSGATLTYNNTTAASITINAEFDNGDLTATEYVVYIKAPKTSNLMLVITKQS